MGDHLEGLDQLYIYCVLGNFAGTAWIMKNLTLFSIYYKTARSCKRPLRRYSRSKIVKHQAKRGEICILLLNLLCLVYIIMQKYKIAILSTSHYIANALCIDRLLFKSNSVTFCRYFLLVFTSVVSSNWSRRLQITSNFVLPRNGDRLWSFLERRWTSVFLFRERKISRAL